MGISRFLPILSGKIVVDQDGGEIRKSGRRRAEAPIRRRIPISWTPRRLGHPFTARTEVAAAGYAPGTRSVLPRPSLRQAGCRHRRSASAFAQWPDDRRRHPRSRRRLSNWPMARSSLWRATSRKASCSAPSIATGSWTKCLPISSGSTTSISFWTKAPIATWSPNTNATRSVRTCWANSGICWKPRPRARPCSSTWITGNPWGPTSPRRPRPPQERRRGLNENYGRELLELHTLGVDGGYTQKDVTEAARCFTGWTINQPQRGGAFHLQPAHAR